MASREQEAAPKVESRRFLFRNIAIAGKIGTGTSVLSQALSAELGWPHHNIASKLFRSLLGPDLQHYGSVPEEVDFWVDRRVRRLMGRAHNELFEGRTVGVNPRPGFFRILLRANLNTRVERTRGREILETLLERDRGEEEKYERMYGINPFDPYADPKGLRLHYHLVMHTDTIPLQDAAAAVVKLMQSPFLRKGQTLEVRSYVEVLSFLSLSR